MKVVKRRSGKWVLGGKNQWQVKTENDKQRNFTKRRREVRSMRKADEEDGKRGRELKRI